MKMDTMRTAVYLGGPGAIQWCGCKRHDIIACRAGVVVFLVKSFALVMMIFAIHENEIQLNVQKKKYSAIEIWMQDLCISVRLIDSQIVLLPLKRLVLLRFFVEYTLYCVQSIIVSTCCFFFNLLSFCLA